MSLSWDLGSYHWIVALIADIYDCHVISESLLTAQKQKCTDSKCYFILQKNNLKNDSYVKIQNMFSKKC